MFSTSAWNHRMLISQNFTGIEYITKMEGGYTTIDDGALSVRSDQKLFLIRLPKDVRDRLIFLREFRVRHLLSSFYFSSM